MLGLTRDSIGGGDSPLMERKKKKRMGNIITHYISAGRREVFQLKRAWYMYSEPFIG